MNWPIYVSIGIENLLMAFETTIRKYNYKSLYRAYLNHLEYYPVTTILTTISVVTYAIPIAFFVGFALVTSIVIFSGFLIIEGIILGIALVVLFAVLAFITGCLGSLILACWSFGYLFAQLFQIASMNVTMEPVAVGDGDRNQSKNHHHRPRSCIEET